MMGKGSSVLKSKMLFCEQEHQVKVETLSCWELAFLKDRNDTCVEVGEKRRTQTCCVS